jgi:hypothetical protein
MAIADDDDPAVVAIGWTLAPRTSKDEVPPMKIPTSWLSLASISPRNTTCVPLKRSKPATLRRDLQLVTSIVELDEPTPAPALSCNVTFSE